MDRLLIICQNIASFDVLERVGTEALQSSYDVTFLYHGRKPDEFFLISSKCVKAGFTCVSSEDFKANEPVSQPLLKANPYPRKARKLYREALHHAHKFNTRRLKGEKPKQGLREKLFGRFFPLDFEHTNVWPLHTALSVKLSTAINIIDKLYPSAIVTSADGISGYLELLTVAKNNKVPIVTISYGFPLNINLEISMKQKSNLGRLVTVSDSSYGKFVKKYCSQWVKKGNFEGALMFSAEHIVALETLGITLDRPWSIIGDLGDYICTENEVNHAYYIKEGVLEKKLSLVGSPYCDIIYEVLQTDDLARSAFLSCKRINSGRTRILISWPTDYHDQHAGLSEFPSYEKMTEEVMLMLSSFSNCDVTVSCHPAMSQKEKDFISTLGIYVSDDYIVTLIPKHDIFISWYSTTTRWALAAGKVVINYDMYKLKLDMYDNAPGFYSSEKLFDIKSEIKRLTIFPGELEGVMEKQVSNASEWGIVDGMCSQRIVRLIDRSI